MEGFGSANHGGQMTIREVNRGYGYYVDNNVYAHGSVSRIPSNEGYIPRFRRIARPWKGGGGEWKRKKRIAKYKLYSVEGKVKNSLRKGFRWFKNTCSRIVHGF
ncbi:hypothetical protein BUALT_Bualt19G0067800 [Buddleja alternifolia]|uniref:Uncharacterized protein n=1 Tax=Buddleja alternifolia TaxID=168488 RepID=A0AAV6W2D7_9LAMI|nr:hypothetical protein BUALT_Bualt19G0067800 [Buddleja alternifolia]